MVVRTSGTYPPAAGGGTLAALIGASCLTAMAATAITPSLPGMAEAFADTPNSEFLVKLALTLPALVIAMSAAPVGLLADRIGARGVLAGSALLFALAGSAGLYAMSLPVLLAGRALLGIAIAGMSTGTLALIGSLYHGDDRKSVVGYQGAAMSFGGMAFLIVGGLLAGHGWRWPFASYLIALALVPLMLARLPRNAAATADTVADHRPVDWPTVVFAYAAIFLGMVFFYVIPVQLPFHLRDHGLGDPALAGYALSLCTFTGGATAFFHRRIRSAISARAAIALAFLLIAIGQGLAATGDYGLVLAGMAIAGVATGLLVPGVNGMVLAATPAGRQGRFAGGVATFLFLGQFMAPFSIEAATRSLGSVLPVTAMGAGMTALAIAAFGLAMRRPSPRA